MMHGSVILWYGPGSTYDRWISVSGPGSTYDAWISGSGPGSIYDAWISDIMVWTRVHM